MPSQGSVAPKERVNIVYRPATDGAQEEVELPLKLLVLGDYTLRDDPTPVDELSPVGVDKDNFDDVLAAQAPRLELQVPDFLQDQRGATLQVQLRMDADGRRATNRPACGCSSPRSPVCRRHPTQRARSPTPVCRARDCDAHDAQCSHCELGDSDWQRADLSSSAWLDCSMQHACLAGATARDICLHGADARDTDLAGADLQGSRADDGTRLQHARLRAADLRQACWEGAALHGADLRECRLDGADLSRVQARGASLRAVDASSLRLDAADLRDADLRDAKLLQASLAGANLRGARLDGALCFGAVLCDIDVDRAGLRGADLRRTIVAARDAVAQAQNDHEEPR